MAEARNWFEIRPEGVDIHVRLTPRGGSDRIEAIAALADGSNVLTARVRAVAEKGKANAALEKLVAHALRVAPATVSVASGHKGRRKRVHVSGDPQSLKRSLIALGKTLD